MYSTLHQQRVDSIIELFEKDAFDGPMPHLPSLYTFCGTSNNTIQFCPYTKDGTNWVSYVWTNTKYAYMRDVRDIIHGLMSNGYTPFYKNVYRDIKCPARIVWDREKREHKPVIVTRNMRASGKPCTHLLAFYLKDNRRIYFCPMYTKTVPEANVRHGSVGSEVKTQ